MSHYLIDMEDYYSQGEKALEEGNYELAANYFKYCNEIYEEADFPFYSERIHFLGNSSLEKYEQIKKNFLGEKKTTPSQKIFFGKILSFINPFKS